MFLTFRLYMTAYNHLPFIPLPGSVWMIGKIFDINSEIAYNMLNRLAEEWVHFTRPGESNNSYIKSKPFPNLPEYRTAYFLFFRFRIATTSDANVSRIMNSSYVLIKYHTFLQTRERLGARPSASRVSILCCHGAICSWFFNVDCI